jgi:hypothetical protein
LWYETTAIPEIRLQVAALAHRIVSMPTVSRCQAMQPDAAWITSGHARRHRETRAL